MTVLDLPICSREFLHRTHKSVPQGAVEGDGRMLLNNMTSMLLHQRAPSCKLMTNNSRNLDMWLRMDSNKFLLNLCLQQSHMDNLCPRDTKTGNNSTNNLYIHNNLHIKDNSPMLEV